VISYEVRLVALFCDAIYLAVRPQGPKQGVLCAWGFTTSGERTLVSVCLGMRESHEDWLALGRDLIARGLAAPMLIVADGAPGLLKAVEQCWPHSDRQHCTVHRPRNLLAKLPQSERQRVRQAYWQRWMTQPTNATAPSGCKRWSTSSTEPATQPRPDAWPTISRRSLSTCATRPGTAGAGAQRTCSSDRSARSNGAPR
jgi:transposase-like protein